MVSWWGFDEDAVGPYAPLNEGTGLMSAMDEVVDIRRVESESSSQKAIEFAESVAMD
jgi:hypothetical protein